MPQPCSPRGRGKTKSPPLFRCVHARAQKPDNAMNKNNKEKRRDFKRSVNRLARCARLDSPSASLSNTLAIKCMAVERSLSLCTQRGKSLFIRPDTLFHRNQSRRISLNSGQYGRFGCRLGSIPNPSRNNPNKQIKMTATFRTAEIANETPRP